MAGILIILAFALLLGMLLGLSADDRVTSETDYIEQLDTMLPQTQCGQCGYSGCAPYASAILAGEVGIDQCPPGGTKIVRDLSRLLGLAGPFLKAMDDNEAVRKIAFIDEDSCIGCVKCIRACPVDAIVGAVKQMHTVVPELCTGCELCVAPCPVDCISMQTVNPMPLT